MPPPDLYSAGLNPDRFGFVLVPVRRVLRRLLAPKTEVEIRLFEELQRNNQLLGARLAQLERRVDALELGHRRSADAIVGRQDILESDVSRLAALLWDHQALVRRLGSIEERLLAEQGPTDNGGGSDHAPSKSAAE